MTILLKNIDFLGINFKDKRKPILELNKENIKEKGEKLQEKNYNLYFILNDFYRKRRESDLIGFKFIGIDLDLNGKHPFPELNDLLLLGEKELGFKPYRITRTFKGYHLFFKLGEEFYYMDKEDYSFLYNKINKIYRGDLRMKKITSILKIPNSLDLKENRHFRIKEIYLNKENIIKKEHFYNLFKRDFRIDYKRKEKWEVKEQKRKRNQFLIEDIDPFDLIEALNDFFPDIPVTLTKRIGGNNYFIDDTDGLAIYKDEKGNSKIKDYSYRKNGKKIRAGNFNFLFNYFYEKHKDKVKITDIYLFLKREFNISLNRSLNTEAIFSIEIKNNFRRLLRENNIDLDSTSLGFIEKLLRIVFYEWAKNNNSFKKVINLRIERKELLKKMGLDYYQKRNKDKLDESLIFLNKLIYNKEKTYPSRLLVEYNNFLIFNKDKVGRNIFYDIEIPIKTYRRIWSNSEIFNIKTKNYKKLLLMYEIIDEVSLVGKWTKEVEEVYNFLELGKTQRKKSKIKKILKELKERGLIKNYIIEFNTIIIN